MTIYEYVAYDLQGNRNEGQVEAAGGDQAQEKIQGMGLIPIELSAKREGLQYSLTSLRYLIFRAPSLREVEYFVSELSLLLNNGIRLNRALEMVSRNIVHPNLKSVVRSLYERIRQGDSLYESMKEYPRYFDRMVLNLVDLGEHTGKLAEMFREISGYLKFRTQLHGKVIGSLTYPCFIMAVCILSMLFLFYFVVPRFADLFAQMEAIPVYTSVLLGTSHFVTQYLWYVIAAVGLLGVLFFRMTGHAELSGARDRFMLFVPFLRSITENAECLRFAKSMYVLLRNQVQLDKSLRLAVSFVNNEIIRSRLAPMVRAVKGGASCTSALQDTRFFPPFFINLVEIGEETGNMAAVFGEIAGELERKFDQTLQQLITLIEPLAIIFMALIVGTIIVIIMLSIISVYDIQF